MAILTVLWVAAPLAAVLLTNTHPQKLAVGIYQFWGLQLVAHGGLPGGGHRGYKGEFGHVGMPPEV